MKESNPIVEKSFQFSLRIIEFTELLEERKKFVIARQLLKSGTSIGANVREAQNAESKADFIHKLKVSLKECDETAYWLELCESADSYPSDSGLIELNLELRKILTKIVYTTRKSA